MPEYTELHSDITILEYYSTLILLAVSARPIHRLDEITRWHPDIEAPCKGQMAPTGISAG